MSFIEKFSPQPVSKQAAAGPSQAAEEGKLKEACQQFEEMFLTQMMKQMRKSTPGSGGNEEKQFAEMLDGERAKSWSADGGVGMASMMFEQMKKNM